ncbi:energy transducer TonB [Endothiovibrio diazotrophicus]
MSATFPYSDAPGVTPFDRLGLTLFIALVLHAILILGLGFDWDNPAERTAPPTLDVVLAQPREAPEPEEAEYLAPTNNEGAGNVTEPSEPEQRRADPAALQHRSTPVPPVLNNAPPQKPASPSQVVTAQQAKRAAPVKRAPATHQEKALPSAAQLMELSLEMARLEAGISETQRAYAKRKRQRYIDATTREHLYAAYMAAWVAKVEKVGNLNYPGEARRRSLSGALILDVALNADGSLNGISLLRSSGERVLDDAAIRIVRLSAPYAPFPKKMARDIDVLHITKTWQFLNSNRWSGG